MQNESDEKKKLKDDNQYMHDWMMEMSNEVKDAKEEAKEAMRKASTSTTLASNRLRLLKELILVEKMEFTYLQNLMQ